MAEVNGQLRDNEVPFVLGVRQLLPDNSHKRAPRPERESICNETLQDWVPQNHCSEPGASRDRDPRRPNRRK
jgi:hypothetical protein